MKTVVNEVVGLAEKIADQSIKGKNLEVLGLAVPSSFEEVGLAGVTVSIVKAAKAISDHLFSKAFANFTNELASLTPEQKMRFFDKYSEKNIQEFGEQALLILNKIEMPLASKMMGKAYYLWVLEEIKEGDYSNYCHIIKNLNLYLFTQIKEVYGKNVLMDFSGGVYALLASYGLVDEVPKGMYPSNTVSATEYSKSEFGKLFFERIVAPFAVDD